MSYEIWYKTFHRVRHNSEILRLDTKAEAKAWITKNIDQAFLRKDYRVKKV
jgi:hypothetical protein